MQLSIKLNAARVLAKFARVKAACTGAQVQAVLKVAAAELHDELIMGAFDAARAPGRGGAWAALKPATIERKRKKRRPLDPLVFTGRLKNTGTFAQAKERGIVFGVLPAYAYGMAHQQGTPTVPRRPFLPVTIDYRFDDHGPASTWLIRLREALKRHLRGA